MKKTIGFTQKEIKILLEYYNNGINRKIESSLFDHENNDENGINEIKDMIKNDSHRIFELLDWVKYEVGRRNIYP